jgi:hypothetical protein
MDITSSIVISGSLAAMLRAVDSVRFGPSNISSEASFAMDSARVYEAAVPYSLKLTGKR